MLGFAILLLLILVSQWRTMARERESAREWGSGIGKIVQRWSSRSASAIKYEFQDSAGETHRQTGTDYSLKLQEGMLVPVFYDRRNPSRQVPACGTYHEVVLPKYKGPDDTANDIARGLGSPAGRRVAPNRATPCNKIRQISLIISTREELS